MRAICSGVSILPPSGMLAFAISISSSVVLPKRGWAVSVRLGAIALPEFSAELTAGLPILLDLIDVNDPTGQFRRPDSEEANAFRDALSEELAMPVQRRYSGGQDIHGACGMLAARAGGE